MRKPVDNCWIDESMLSWDAVNVVCTNIDMVLVLIGCIPSIRDLVGAAEAYPPVWAIDAGFHVQSCVGRGKTTPTPASKACGRIKTNDKTRETFKESFLQSTTPFCPCCPLMPAALGV
jgi:hypothetical protein